MFSSAHCAPVVDLLPVTYFTFSPAYRSLPCAPVVDLLTYFSFSPSYRTLPCAPVVDLLPVTFDLGDL